MHPAEHPVEDILRSWLDDPNVTIFCGHWRQGGIMELLPSGGASLSAPRYDPPFHGLRELRLAGSAHHVHLDLGKLTRAWYVVTSSVCYGFRPSFELRLTAESANPLESFGLGLSIGRPYEGGRMRSPAVERYLHRAVNHLERFPGVVAMLCNRSGAAPAARHDWDVIDAVLDGVRCTGELLLEQT